MEEDKKIIKKGVRLPTGDEEFLYFTNRTIYQRGDDRKKTWTDSGHKAKVWVFKDEPEIANVEYSCPYCGIKAKFQKKWTKPFKFECINEKCGKKINIKKLK